MSSTQVPSKTQILVIGGGPSGSYSACCLAREGFDVTLFEAAAFPRYHIGESLIPSMKTYLDFIGCYEKVKSFGFVPKTGGAFRFNHHKREGYTSFSTFSDDIVAWHVTRADFDDILLNHARECGVKVFEQTKVTNVEFEDNDTTKRPVSATYSKDGTNGSISFDFVVDASGRNGIISTKCLKNRIMNPALKNTAIWGYWTGCNTYGIGTERENGIYNEALNDESGFAWYIPLQDGTISVGLVMEEAKVVKKKAAYKAALEGKEFTLENYYVDELYKLCPDITGFMTENAKLVKVGKDGGPHVKQAADYSYTATNYAGPGYRLVGDAGCFIDPFFSSGVHLAFTSAMSAAATVASSIRGISEPEACRWHHTKVGVAYTRFLMIVLSSYKQIHDQKADLMSGADEDNFDRAFDLIRPIIQGTADVNKKLTEDEVDQTMDFVKDIAFGPGKGQTPAQLYERYQTHEQDIRPDNYKTKKLDGLFAMENNFVSEVIHGHTVLLERGKLGMVPVKAA